MSRIPTPPPFSAMENRGAENRQEHLKYEDYELCIHNLDLFINKSITKVNPIAQNGPNCGLAALAMVSALTPNPFTISDIFAEAKARGFTFNGEIFSVSNMKTLAECILSPWFTTVLYTNGLAINKSEVVERLYSGDFILIPYDADKDHSPCCRKGHKAHWALLCGVMTSLDGEIFVAARHGKSRYMGVWSLDSLQLSNDNLTELDPVRVNDDNDYLLPLEGVKQGLCSKFILLKKKNI